MKKITLLITLLLGSQLYAEASGAALFEAKCAACHTKFRPNDLSTLVAPPMMGVARHVKMHYPTKEAAVTFMVNYIFNPNPVNAVCMPGKIRRFGLMPSQKGNLTTQEAQSIAGWVYDNFGNQGRGMGQNCGLACQGNR